MNNKFHPVVSFHPGRTLNEKLTEMDLTSKEFAQRTQIPVFIIDSFIEGNTSVTADMALAFEQETQIPARYWLNVQHEYDEYILDKQPAGFHQRLSSLQASLSRRVASILL